MQSHGQAGQRPDRSTAGDHPVGGLRGGHQHLGDGTDPLGGQFGDGRSFGSREPVPRVELSPDPGGAEGHAGHGPDRVDRADAGFKAPASQVQPEHRAVPHPDAGPLTEETQPGLLLTGQQRDRAPEDPLQSAEQARAVVGVAQGGGGQGYDHVDPGVLGSHVQPLDRTDGERGAVSGHAARSGDLGPEVQEGAASQDRLQPTVARGVDHHEVEGAAAQVEHGYTDGGHRGDAIPHGRGRGQQPPWPTLGATHGADRPPATGRGAAW